MTPTPTTPAECRAEQERVLEQATAAVNKMLRGKLWLHVKTGGVYLEYGRGDTVFDKKAGDRLFSGIMGAPLIEATDDIAAGELFVRYRNILTGESWARPARLFDDGRFVPLTLAPALAQPPAEPERALEELKSAMRKILQWNDRWDGTPLSDALYNEAIEQGRAALTQPTPEPDASHKVPQVEPEVSE